MIPEHSELLQRLARRGLIAPRWTVRRLTGNADRKPTLVRHHYLLEQPGGPVLKLTVGTALSAPRQRAQELAAAVPELAPREMFFERDGDMDVWATEAVSGQLAEEADSSSQTSAQLLATLDAYESNLHGFEDPTDADSFSREWNAFLSSLLSLPCWLPAESSLIAESGLCGLQAQLASLAQSRRWTNGDFTSSNFCVRPNGRAALFDAEHAACSCFFPEDRVRFLRLSPLCHRHPGLFANWWPAPIPAWEAFFQMRQLLLEHRENSTAYTSKWTAFRKSAARFFLQSWWRKGFPYSWPDATDPREDFDGETVQLFWGKRPHDFSEHQSARVRIRSGVRQLAAFRFPETFRAWRLDPAVTRRTIVIHSLTPVMPGGTRNNLTALAFAVSGAVVSNSASGTRIEPHHDDPQLHFVPPAGATGVVIDLQCF